MSIDSFYIGLAVFTVLVLLVSKRETELSLKRAQEDSIFWMKKYYELSEQVFRDFKLPTEEMDEEEMTSEEDLEDSGERVSSPRR